MKTLILIDACILIIIFLITEGKTDGFLETSQVYKNVKARGAEKIFNILTAIFSIMFIVLSLVEVIG